MATRPSNLHKELQDESPKMDAAFKSFASLQAAKEQSSLTEILAYTRGLSKACNAYIFPIYGDQSEEYEVAAQLWNQVVGMKHKVTHLMGRRALRQAWPDLMQELVAENDDTDENRARLAFYKEFEGVLLKDDHPDAPLVWTTTIDRKIELHRRATERQQHARERREQQGMWIEELTDVVREGQQGDEKPDEKLQTTHATCHKA